MATGLARTIAALDELSRIEAALDDTIARREGEWKRAYVRLRNEFQQLISRIADLPRDWVGITEEQDREYRSVYNHLRAAAALHQSTWPVVTIDHEDPAYHASARNLRAASQALKDIIRRHSSATHQPSLNRSADARD